MISASISMPLTDRIVSQLRAGDRVTLTGTVYAATSPAFRHVLDAARQEKNQPIDLDGQVVCFLDQAIPPSGAVRRFVAGNFLAIDRSVSWLLAEGVRGVIANPIDSASTRYTFRKYGAVHFGAEDGVAAHAVSAQVVLDDGLGTVVLVLTLRDFPVVVTNDMYGGELA